jgi:RES domain-containing protein
VVIPASIPDDLVESLVLGSLVSGWNDPSDLRQTQKIGDEWLESCMSVALRVPSALVPREFNVLLSPEHPDWQKVEIGDPEAFRFDARLGDGGTGPT